MFRAETVSVGWTTSSSCDIWDETKFPRQIYIHRQSAEKGEPEANAYLLGSLQTEGSGGNNQILRRHFSNHESHMATERLLH